MTGSELLKDAGKISNLEAENKAIDEYIKYREKTKDELSEVEKHFIESIKEAQKSLEQKDKNKNDDE